MERSVWGCGSNKLLFDMTWSYEMNQQEVIGLGAWSTISKIMWSSSAERCPNQNLLLKRLNCLDLVVSYDKTKPFSYQLIF